MADAKTKLAALVDYLKHTRSNHEQSIVASDPIIAAHIKDLSEWIDELEPSVASTQSAGQLAFAWATHHDQPMLFIDREEAALYCEDDEQPIPLYAAPVNGAEQSVGQEAVVLTDDLVSSTLKEYQLALQTDPRNTDQMRNSPTWPRIVDSMQKGAMREALTFALGRSAVPVNGGERDAALEKAWNFVDAVRLLITPGAFDLRDSPVSLIRNLESLLEHVEAARAADAPQANALPAFTDPLVQKVYQILCNTLPAPQGEHWEGWVARHICAAISAPAKADGDEREAFDALVGKKIAEADVRGNCSYVMAQCAGIRPRCAVVSREGGRG